MKPFLNIAEINARLRPRFTDLVQQMVGAEPTARTRTELRFGTRGSLAVVVAGPKAGAWHDHETDDRGDPVAFIAYRLHCSMGEAREWALRWLGEAIHLPAPRPAPAPAQPASSSTLPLAKAIWREAMPAAGTIVEVYLQARRLTLPPDAPIRFHPRCPRGEERLPAMLALMTDAASGTPCGVHRTFLRQDGSWKAGGVAKMMAGNAGVIRLAPTAPGGGLGVAEGIETALAVMQRLGRSPVWAASSTAGITRFPVLDGVTHLTVWADAGEPGLNAARACCMRWADAGVAAELRAPTKGSDWDDATRPPEGRA